MCVSFGSQGKLLAGPIATVLKPDTSIIPPGTITHLTKKSCINEVSKAASAASGWAFGLAFGRASRRGEGLASSCSAAAAGRSFLDYMCSLVVVIICLSYVVIINCVFRGSGVLLLRRTGRCGWARGGDARRSWEMGNK